jgi:hypothetical protein
MEGITVSLYMYFKLKIYYYSLLVVQGGFIVIFLDMLTLYMVVFTPPSLLHLPPLPA